MAGCLKTLLQQLTETTKSLKKQGSIMGNLKNENDELYNKIYSLEKDVINVYQYQCRNNIVLVGIPLNIKHSKLENHLLEIINKMGVKLNGKIITSYDIVACHRLRKIPGSSSQNVIVRFVNRKVATECFRKKKQLINIKKHYKYNYLNIIENLCNRTQSLYDYCRKLKQGGDINRLWIFNGVVHIKFDDNEDEVPTKLYHPDDINYYFDESSLLLSSVYGSYDVDSSIWL